MTGADIAGLLKEYGWPGACALLIVAIVSLFKTLQASQDARITDGRLAIGALTRQASTNAEIATMMASLREGQTEVMRIAALIQRDAENDDERVREKIAGLTEAMKALVARLETIGTRLENLCRGGAR